MKLPLKRRHPISQQTLSSFFFSCSPKNRALSHFVRTGRGPFDTGSAYLIYYLPLGWPCFVHKLPPGARDTGIQEEAVLLERYHPDGDPDGDPDGVDGARPDDRRRSRPGRGGCPDDHGHRDVKESEACKYYAQNFRK